MIISIVRPDADTSKDANTEGNQPTISITGRATLAPPSTVTEDAKINPGENLCPQISKEFVTKVTGITIEKASALNGPQINACDYYLADDKNAPYIAIVVNKNLNFEKHKQIAVKNKLTVKTDERILGNHYIAWADKETRISNINLYIDENSFLRIDKNVERAIDNEGMIKLAGALSTRL
ncbi:MAG: hypothetical protein WC686_03040 [Candidatus Shapirobacteria bacterium]